MGKIIKKPPKTPADFKAKRMKVGKQLQPQNVTKISVKSKVIYVPNQTTEKNLGNFHAILDKQIQFLHHHAAKTRVMALEKISDMVLQHQIIESYIPVLITSVMDVLQDEDSDVRTAVLDLFTAICRRYHPDVFAACSSILVTYMCSGLTILTKSIRRDTLKFMKVFCDENCAEFISAHREKVLALLQRLLEDAIVGFNFSTEDATVSSATKHITSSSKTAALSAARIISNNMAAPNKHSRYYAGAGSSTANSSTGSAEGVRGGGRSAATAPAPSSSASLFGLVLQVIGHLVRGDKSNSEGSSQLVDDDAVAGDTQGGSVVANSSNGGAPVNFFFLRSSFSQSQSGEVGSFVSGSHGGAGSTSSDVSAVRETCSTLVALWRSISSDHRLLANESIQSLQEVVNVMLAIACNEEYAVMARPSLVALIRDITGSTSNALAASKAAESESTFPYASAVLAVSLPDSIEHTTATGMLDRLNLSVCKFISAVGDQILPLGNESAMDQDLSPVTASAAMGAVDAVHVMEFAVKAVMDFELELLHGCVVSMQNNANASHELQLSKGGASSAPPSERSTVGGNSARYTPLLPTVLKHTRDNLSNLISCNSGKPAPTAADSESTNYSDIIGSVTRLFDVVNIVVKSIQINAATHQLKMQQYADRMRQEATAAPAASTTDAEISAPSTAGVSKSSKAAMRELSQLLCMLTESVCGIARKLIDNERYHFTGCMMEGADDCYDTQAGSSEALVAHLFATITRSLGDIMRTVLDDDYTTIVAASLASGTVQAAGSSSVRIIGNIMWTLQRVAQAHGTKLEGLLSLHQKRGTKVNQNELSPEASLLKELQVVLSELYTSVDSAPSPLMVRLWKGFSAAEAGTELHPLKFRFVDLWFYSKFALPRPTETGAEFCMVNALNSLNCSEASAAPLVHYCNTLAAFEQ